jgi:hypothetical protein
MVLPITSDKITNRKSNSDHHKHSFSCGWQEASGSTPIHPGVGAIRHPQDFFLPKIFWVYKRVDSVTVYRKGLHHAIKQRKDAGLHEGAPEEGV